MVFSFHVEPPPSLCSGRY